MLVSPVEKKAYMEASPAQRETTRKLLCTLLALLRAQSLSYQTSHWQATGDAFYGDHLLFQRLYESVGAQIDGLAEKIVGYLGNEPVGMSLQAPLISHFGLRWAAVSCPHKRGLLSEKDCQASIKAAYDGIKAAQAMTLGLDDWLMATANAHDENVYLLQQVRKAPHGKAAALVEGWASKIAVEQVAPSAEDAFRPNPRKEEVREFAESQAISNSPEIAEEAVQDDNFDISPAEAVADANEAPLTPDEIEDLPGGEEVSTLNRYVVESEDPATEEAAEFNRQKMAHWLDQIETRSSDEKA